uniref:Uncharacterized protein n=1 Tax=Setaria italica TaxID=4555 RepID=K3Z165_SETIT
MWVHFYALAMEKVQQEWSTYSIGNRNFQELDKRFRN